MISQRTSSSTLLRITLALAILLGVSYVAYLPGLTGPFLLDDTQLALYKVNNLSWDELKNTTQSTGRFNGLSRILPHITFALSDYTSGTTPRLLKHQNLLLHQANALLVLWLALCLIRLSPQAPFPPEMIALVVASVWLLHPLQLSTTLYPIQRLVLLATFFTLITLILYVKGRSLLPGRPRLALLIILGAFLLFWPLALSSKETAALVPLHVLLIEYFFFSSEALTRPRRNTRNWILILFCVIPVALSALALATNWDRFIGGYAGRDFDMSQRLMTEVHAMWLYIKLIVIPIPSSMSLFHDGFPIQRALDADTILLAFGLIAPVSLAPIMRKHAPLVGFGLLFFLACHILESTFIPLELVFEHRNYLAIFGISLALVYLGAYAASSSRMTRIAIVGTLGLLVLLTLNTAARAFAWSSAELLFTTELETQPNSRRVHEGLFRIAQLRGDDGKALAHLERIRQLSPQSASADLLELKLLCDDPNDSHVARLIDRSTEALRTGPVDVLAMNSVSTLMKLFVQEKCPAISIEDVYSLTEAAVSNRNVHTTSVRLGALARAGTGAALAGKPKKLWRYSFEALELAHGTSPAQFRVALAVAANNYAERFPEKLQKFLDEAALRYGRYMASQQLSIQIDATAARSLVPSPLR